MTTVLAQYGILLMTLCMNVVFGLSVQVVIRAGVFSLASAGFYGLGAYMTAILAREMPWQLAALVGVAICAALALIVGMVFVRLRGLYLGMATIAFVLLAVSIANSWVGVTGGSAGLYGITRHMTLEVAVVIAIVAVVVVALWQSRAGGRFADVLRVDEQLALTMGVETNKLRLSTLVLSGALGGLAGTMAPMIFGVMAPSEFGFSLIILGLTIVIIGGSSSWAGALIGAVVVTLLPQVLVGLDRWRDLGYGLIVILMILFAPQGIYGIARRGWLAVRRGRKGSKTEVSVHDDDAHTLNSSTSINRGV